MKRYVMLGLENNIFMMPIFPKQIQYNPKNPTTGIFVEIDKQILKFIQKYNGLKVAKRLYWIKKKV